MPKSEAINGKCIEHRGGSWDEPRFARPDDGACRTNKA